jgi:hypothetical protein
MVEGVEESGERKERKEEEEKEEEERKEDAEVGRLTRVRESESARGRVTSLGRQPTRLARNGGKQTRIRVWV